MAKYTITHTCGHESTMDIPGGKPALRQWKIEQAELQICWECQKAAKAAAAAQIAEAAGLPELVGSEKQVGWALTLRDQSLAAFDRVVDTYLAKLGDAPEAKVAPFKAIFAEVRTAFAAEAQAKVWIDGRYDDHESNAERAIRAALQARR